jgi:outer membrane protein OmpA-like peptidoglycan-associated protein/opacity protein-like surface antigen
MRLGLRMFATIVVAFSLQPALLAEDSAKPAATANTDGAVDSRAPFGAVSKAKPALTLPEPVLASPMPQLGPRRHSLGADNTAFPKGELFLGYSYMKNLPDNAGNRIVHLNGGSTSLALNVNRHLGLVADIGGFHADKFGPNAPPSGGVVNASGNVFSFMFGPRLSFRNDKVTPFVQALFGGVHAGAVTLSGCSGIGCTPLPSESAFAMALGGGLDVKVHRHVSLRLFQIEYLMTRFGDRTSSTLQTARQNDVRISAGLVFRFGGNRPTPPPPPPATPPPPPPVTPPPQAANEPRPNRPPIMTCSADRSSMVVGERAQITATASSPDNNPLTYSWSTRGQTLGPESSVTFDSSGMAPGRYTVTGHVDDGRGGAADCSVDLDVQAAQVNVPVVLERTLALHSIYFPTAQPTVNDPNGGLVESQQTILRTLAVDFKKYLEFHPDAHLTLEGHADERASVEYNNALAERRVARSKSFLVEQGVPEADIETQSFGKHEELNASQVRQQMEDNPDLTSEQRTKLFTNLKSIILAQNRRVDIVLTSTGRKSVRRYPFNASDALTLLSDRALQH